MSNGQRFSISKTALDYTWRQLASRAGVSENTSSGTGVESLGVDVYYSRPDDIQVKRPSVIVAPCGADAVTKLLELKPRALTWHSIADVTPRGSKLPFDANIPILLWAGGCEDGSKPFAEKKDDNTVVFHVDIIAASLFMLSRWEETVVPARDKHDRFPGPESVAYKQGFLDQPIVDQYALILRAWLQALLPEWNPKRRQFSIRLSHDIDRIKRFPNLRKMARSLGAALLKRFSIHEAADILGGLFGRQWDPRKDIYFERIQFLARLSKEHGLKSSFYFMAAKPSKFDSGYDPSSPMVEACLRGLRQQGHEVGFHAGYDTWDNMNEFLLEKKRLETALGEKIAGGRQHYLRFRAPETWRQWEKAGFSYDSTMTYAEHEGFRCGTCHPFHPFDIERDQEFKISEVPLVIMDGTLWQYRKLSMNEAKSRIMDLAGRCKQAEGTFTLLWHNSSFEGEWASWTTQYPQLLDQLRTL